MNLGSCLARRLAGNGYEIMMITTEWILPKSFLLVHQQGRQKQLPSHLSLSGLPNPLSPGKQPLEQQLLEPR